MLILFAIVYTFLYPSYYLASCHSIAAFLLLICFFGLYRQKGNVDFISQLALSIAFLEAYNMNLVQGGMFAIGIYWMLHFVIATAIMSSLRTFIIWILILIFTFFLYPILTPLVPESFLVHIGTEDYKTFHIICWVSGVLFLAFMILYYFNAVRTTMLSIRESKDELDRLLKIVGHDLCNPLFVISVSSEVLLQRHTDMSDDLKDKIDRIKTAATFLKNNLDKVRMLQQGNLEQKPINIDHLITTCQELFQERLDTKNINLKIENQLSPLTKIWGDEDVIMNQVFSNLISNAIKFSPEGSTITWRIEKNDNQNIAFHLSDQGIGIPKEMRSSLFSFEKDHVRFGTSGEKGSGMGLGIVHHFVTKMNGKIKVAENPDQKGACFTVTFASV